MAESEAKNSKCRIIVDAMGGDYAPQNAVVGALEAYNEKRDFELFLVGKKEEILSVIKSNNLSFDEKYITKEVLADINKDYKECLKELNGYIKYLKEAKSGGT